MKARLASVVWPLGIFTVVCSLGMFALLTLFAELRFEEQAVYKAEFSNVSGLEEGNFVRVAGVEVGKVKKIDLLGDTALVEFSADNAVVLTRGTQAAIRYDNPIGGRFLELLEGAGGTERLKLGETIPLVQTQPALDLDALIGGFRPLFRALSPDQVNALSRQLIDAFQGQGPTINSVLSHTAALTSTLADRDVLVGQVIANLNTVVGSLSEQNGQFEKAIDSLSELVAGLSERKQDISDAVANANAAAASVTGLLAQAREPFTRVVNESDRANSIVITDHEYVDDLLATLPATYKMLARQGMYGDYFSYYLCDAVLKLNGKGGQPVYVKVASQSNGRCAAR